MRLSSLLPAILLTLAGAGLPLAAEETDLPPPGAEGARPFSPGPLERLMLAHELFARAGAAGDGLAALAAAGLTAEVAFTADEALQPRVEGGEEAGESAPVVSSPALFTAAEMFDQAMALAGGDPLLLELIAARREVAATAAEAGGAEIRAAALRVSEARLAPGAHHIWSLAGGAEASGLAVLGAGQAALVLRLEDGAGGLICAAGGSGGQIHCPIPAGTAGPLSLRVGNGGADFVPYRLLRDPG